MDMESELTTIKIPKVLVESVKSIYNSESITNREFIRLLLLSSLNDGQVALIAKELNVNENQVQLIKDRRKVLLKEKNNATSDVKQNNKRIENMLNKTEFTNQMLLAYIKLMLSDTGYSYPKDIRSRLEKFDDYDKDIYKVLADIFKEG
ncbi:hypothetical protein BU064_03500 [Staphylococcus succinus]|nr:hypothetical protein BU064_03500 [Staphylococcus succinus]